MKNWQQAAEQALGSAIVDLQGLGGGDFARAYRAHLAEPGPDGQQSVFVKTHADPPPGFFSTEATGLGWLGETRTVRVPQVLAVSDDPPFLVMSWIEPQHRGHSTDQRTDTELGRQLAELHQLPQPRFGRADLRTTGSLALPNQAEENWADFYADQRLRPLAGIARTRAALPESTIRRLEKAADTLGDFDIAGDGASLLHGDLWAGNRLIDIQGRSWLIDPAVHCGHREFDLAMMLLFGGYGRACFSAYDEINPLTPGWQQRVPLHQLAPLVVHAIKFGGHYRHETENALSALGL